MPSIPVNNDPKGKISNAYEFDSNLLVVQQVDALENNTKGSFADLLANPVMNTNDVRRRGAHVDRV